MPDLAVYGIQNSDCLTLCGITTLLEQPSIQRRFYTIVCTGAGGRADSVANIAVMAPQAQLKSQSKRRRLLLRLYSPKRHRKNLCANGNKRSV